MVYLQYSTSKYLIVHVQPTRHFVLAHRCKEAGCGTVLVLDGNMKNSRDVCAAQHAGFVEYSGLPGRVTTGCMESPEQSSKFCSQHVTRMSKTVRNRDDPENRQGGVIEMILAKKVTRNNTFYQVLVTPCIFHYHRIHKYNMVMYCCLPPVFVSCSMIKGFK